VLSLLFLSWFKFELAGALKSQHCKNTTVNYFLAIGLTFNLILLLAHCTHEKLKNAEGWLICLLLLTIAFEIANAFLFTSDFILFNPHFLRINTPFVLLLAPGVWLLIRPHLGFSQLTRSDLIHLLPFLLCTVYLLPLYFSSSNEKLAYIQDLISGANRDSYWLGGARRVQQFFYMGLISYHIFNRRTYLEANERNLVWYTTGLLFVIWLIGMFRYLFWFNLFGGLIEVCLLCALSILLVYFKLVAEPKRKNGDKYRTSGLSPEIKLKYVEKIKEALNNESLITNPELTLISFADHLSIPTHHLSEVFSQELKASFKELVNLQRVNVAKNLFDLKGHLKIEAIASEAGFKSISTFNTTFKKITGMRPKDFRQTRVNEVSLSEKVTL